MSTRQSIVDRGLNAEIVLLAGGLSTRMGRDKAQVKIEGRTMLGWVRDAAKRTGLRVRVLRKDRVARCGPIGGIYTGLIRARAPWVLFLPCDMPWVEPAFLLQVLRTAIAASLPAVTRVGRQTGFPMVLQRDMAAEVLGLIEKGEFSLGGMARFLRARHVNVKAGDAKAFGLVNINTPSDLNG